MLEELEFERINGSHNQVQMLYDLFLSRQHHISANPNTEFQAHKEFVKNHPYRVWYIIRENGSVQGTVYLGYNNNIGINLSTEFLPEVDQIIRWVTTNHKPLEEIRSVRPPYFYVNVPASNSLQIESLKKAGYRKIQETFTTSSD